MIPKCCRAYHDSRHPPPSALPSFSSPLPESPFPLGYKQLRKFTLFKLRTGSIIIFHLNKL